MLNGKLLGEAFPINKVEVFFDNLDHSNFLGFSWQLVSQGKIPIGIDVNDSDFNQIGNTGGEKTHTLTIAELASHNHGLNSHTHTYDKVNTPTGGPSTNTSGSTTLTIEQIPSHSHNIASYYQYNNGTGGTQAASTKLGRTTDGADGAKTISPIVSTGGGKGHTHTLSSHTHTTSTTSTNTGKASGNTASSGSGNAHNNMPPYIVMAFWKRIA